MQDPINKQRTSAQKLDAEKKNKAGGKPVKPKGKERAKEPETHKDPETKDSKAPPKSHKKKGTANNAPPSSIGMTQTGFAALLAIEAANPEMTRKQAIENALKLYAGHIAHLPAIHLTRLDSDTLITLAGVAAKRERSCKKIMRDIILSELDNEEKAKHVSALELEIQHLRDE